MNLSISFELLQEPSYHKRKLDTRQYQNYDTLSGNGIKFQEGQLRTS